VALPAVQEKKNAFKAVGVWVLYSFLILEAFKAFLEGFF
jgi:hypothetical protein